MLGLEVGKVKLVKYSSSWKKSYEDEKKHLVKAIGKYIVDIQHVGSTSIPGGIAKPIIDILVGVSSWEIAEKCIDILSIEDYEYQGDHGVPGRYFFVKGTPEKRTHYLHLTIFNSEFWKNLIHFRNYLHSHPEELKEYSKLKKCLCERFCKDRSSYTEGKSDFIKKILNHKTSVYTNLT